MKNGLWVASVIGLAVALAYLTWGNRPQPQPTASETPVAVAPSCAAPSAPPTLPAVVDVLDIDPLLDPPAVVTEPVPDGPVVTAFGGDPVPQPLRPASAVAPIPRAKDEPVNVEVAPMPREVQTDTFIYGGEPVARLVECSELSDAVWLRPIVEPYPSDGEDLRLRVANVDRSSRALHKATCSHRGIYSRWAFEAMCAPPPLRRWIYDSPPDLEAALSYRLDFATAASSVGRWTHQKWYGEDRLPQQARHDWDARRGMIPVFPFE